MTDSWYPLPDPTAIERPSKVCRRHEWALGDWQTLPGPDAIRFREAACRRCGKVRDAAASRRGKNSRARGKRIERVEMRKAGVHTGNAGKSDDGQSTDGMFAYQSKSRASSLFPGWQTAELDKLRTAHPGKVSVLVVIEAPGPGRTPRKIAVLEWSAWLDLHGPKGATE